MGVQVPLSAPFSITYGLPSTGDPYNGIVIPGDSWPDAATGRVPAATDPSLRYLFRGGQESRWYSEIDKLNFQPRLGIVYQLTPRTVIRAGSGKFTTRLGVSDSIFLGGNPPLQPLASVPFGSVDYTSGASLASCPLSVNTQARVFHMPQEYTWNFTFEREFMRSTVLGVSYLGRAESMASARRTSTSR